MRVAFASILILIVLGAAGPLSAAIVNGQLDDFEDGTVQMWAGGITPSPTNIASGGPAGVGDNYLQITGSGLKGSGGSIAAFNDTQWAGDYLSAGVASVQMDVRNFSDIDVHLRILLPFGIGGDFTSASPVIVPNDGNWHTISFGLTAADLFQTAGSGTLEDSLSNVFRLLLRHQPGAPTGVGFQNPINGQLGVDNIRAVPEPAVATLVLIGLPLLRRRR